MLFNQVTDNGQDCVVVKGYFWNQSMQTIIQEVEEMSLNVYVLETPEGPKYNVTNSSFSPFYLGLIPGAQKHWTFTIVENEADPIPYVDLEKYPYWSIDNRFRFSY